MIRLKISPHFLTVLYYCMLAVMLVFGLYASRLAILNRYITDTTARLQNASIPTDKQYRLAEQLRVLKFQRDGLIIRDYFQNGALGHGDRAMYHCVRGDDLSCSDGESPVQDASADEPGSRA